MLDFKPPLGAPAGYTASGNSDSLAPWIAGQHGMETGQRDYDSEGELGAERKQAIRRERNRESARRVRARKAQEYHHMHSELDTLREENALLKAYVRRLQDQVQELSQKLSESESTCRARLERPTSINSEVHTNIHASIGAATPVPMHLDDPARNTPNQRPASNETQDRQRCVVSASQLWGQPPSSAPALSPTPMIGGSIYAPSTVDGPSSASGMQPTQQPVQQAMSQPAQQPVQQPMQQPMQQPVQRPVQQPMQQPVQQPMQQPVQQAMQQPMQQSMQQAMQQVMQQPMQLAMPPTMQAAPAIIPLAVQPIDNGQHHSNSMTALPQQTTYALTPITLSLAPAGMQQMMGSHGGAPVTYTYAYINTPTFAHTNGYPTTVGPIGGPPVGTVGPSSGGSMVGPVNNLMVGTAQQQQQQQAPYGQPQGFQPQQGQQGQQQQQQQQRGGRLAMIRAPWS